MSPDDDWALAQGTVDFRNEERLHHWRGLSPMTALEKQALHDWREWARYRGWHECSACERWMYCGRPRRGSSAWVCVECWSLR